MTSYSNGGFYNYAYHDSETLEIDRRVSSRAPHTNPYARDGLARRDEREDSLWARPSRRGDAAGRASHQEESWRGAESIPMGAIATHTESQSWHPDHNHSTFQTPAQHSRSRPVPLPSSMSGNMTMRWRGVTMRGMNVFPSTDAAHLAFTEDAIRNEMEDEEQNLVKELVALSTQERIQSIRELPMSFEEKKHIRSQVLAFKSAKQSHHFTCFADCSERVSLASRRCGYFLRSAQQTMQLWQGIMKEIGGKFGTSILTYFMFLRWLLMFNIFSFLINFGFITIPLLVHHPSPNIPPQVGFRGLEILTGAGYFNYTVMYYGSYSNATLVGLVEYNMQLAYFFTISIYMVLCGIMLIISMANSFKNNYALVDQASSSAWQLMCSWDFSITNERAVRLRRNNLRVQLKESLSEGAQREQLTVSEKLKHFGIHLGSWFLSTSLAIGCGASIYYLSLYEKQQTTDAASWSPLQEAGTLLVPFVVSLMNLVVPLFFSLFNKFEHYSSQRRQIYAMVVRSVFLKVSILGVLCYYWMNEVAESFSCWESMVGQALYRLVIFDFFFLLLGSLFGEFLSKVIGTRFLPRLGMPEFDVARNVLDLMYAQTLTWIGIYFSPLLPVIQILKFFILFYIKKVSLTQNCQPPRRSGRAAQMRTILIALLFFPFFVGALSIVAYTAWSLRPSKHCGPFRMLNNSFSVVDTWIHDLEAAAASLWVIWIFQNIIKSEIFYFFITLVILVVIYIFWQVTQGRKLLITQLRQQIVNEGKDKSFLLEKLQDLQNKKPKQKNRKKRSSRPSDDRSSGGPSNSNAMVQALIARQRYEEEEEDERYLPPPDLPVSSALAQAMMARQRAEEEEEEEDLRRAPDRLTSSSSALALAMQARQAALEQEREESYSSARVYEDPGSGLSAFEQAMQARRRLEEGGDEADDFPSPMSGVMMQVMQARQRSEESYQYPAPAASSALIQAMLARQQAQNEYDDGY